MSAEVSVCIGICTLTCLLFVEVSQVTFILITMLIAFLLLVSLLLIVFLVGYAFELVALRGNTNGYLINDFLYRRHRENKKGTLLLRCRKHGCNATAQIKDDGQAYLGPHEHDHIPDDLKVLQFKTAVKEAARSPAAKKSSLSDIYHGVRKEFKQATSSKAEWRELSNTLPKETTGIVCCQL